MSKKLSLVSLVVLIVASIDNIRNLPMASLFGSSLIFFFLLSALIFLIPTALVSAELSAAFPEKGGVYHWVTMAFGKKTGMLAIWLQWINTMVWYPTMLLFIAGTLAYAINPALVENKLYLVTTVLSIFWLLTFVNLKGIQVSALINNIFAVMGMIVPLCFLLILGLIWVVSGKPIEIHITKLIPPLTDSANWVSLIAIMASFLGMELSGVHINEIKDPQKNFPKAVLSAAIFIFLTMMFGSLAIAFVLPASEINLVSGVMQVFTSFFKMFGLEPLIPVLTCLIFIGSLGTMINWLISPAKGLLHAAEFGFLPPFFSQKNKYGVAKNILLAQAMLVTLFSLFFLFKPSVNEFYWFLTALSTELYMIMYLLMFLSALKLRYSLKNRKGSFLIPGGKGGIWLITLLGLTGCVTTIIVSFFPPEHIAIGSKGKYLLTIILGNLLTIAPILWFYAYQKKNHPSLGQKV